CHPTSRQGDLRSTAFPARNRPPPLAKYQGDQPMPGRDCLQGAKRRLVQATGLGDRDLLEWPSRRVLVFLVLLGVTAAIVLTLGSDPQWGLPRIQGAGPDRGAVARPVTLRGMVDEAMYRRVVEAV